MFLSNAAVRRPIAMSCLLIGLTLLGLNSARKMGLELMPKVDLPYVTITTVYPGASPEQIETDIAKRIEDQVMTIEGLKHVSSSCMENACQTLLEFEIGVDVDIAATDVREKLDLINAEFPADVEDPRILKYDVNAKPVATLAITGSLPLEELYDYADNTLRDRISTIAGVADVTLVGGAEREVQIILDRNELAARGLTSVDVVRAVQQGIRTIPSGRIREQGIEFSVKFDADFVDVADIANLEIDNQDGRRCYLRDIGQVQMSTAELRQLADVDGKPAVAIKIVKKSDANAVAVVDHVRDAIVGISQDLPGGMELAWITDDEVFIAENNKSAWVNVTQGVILTGLILFFFLYNLRSLFVIAITMPLTIVIGLFFMQMAGFTLNLSTLIAIGMSVGVLVTNSIVVLEAIIRRLDEGQTPKEASVLGASEAFVAVLASASTNVVVLFPMAMMHNLVGLFIRPFALTMVIVTLVSLFISFTLTPLLCSVVLKPRNPNSKNLLTRMETRWNKGFDRLLNHYRTMLLFFEKRRWASILLLVVVLGLFFQSMKLAGTLGSSMVTEADRGEVYVKLEFPTRYSIDKTVQRISEVHEKLQGLPEVRHTLTTIGKAEGMFGQTSEAVNLAQLLIRFSERTERSITIDQLQEEIRTRLQDMPEAIVTVSIPSGLGGQATPVQMEIAGADLDILDQLVLKAKALTEEIKGFRDVDTTVREGKPELRIHPQRTILADMGYPAISLGLALRGNIEGLDAGTYKRDARNYDIVVKLREQQGKSQVQDFLLPGKPGRPVVLSSLGTIEETIAPVQISRKDKQRISQLFSNLGPTLPLGSAVNKLSALMNKEVKLPPGYSYQFTGQYESMTEGQAGLGEAALIAIILVILTLAAILESFRQPWLILVTLPLALIGMIWALWLAGESMGIFIMMGGVMLIGIVVNNAILIMDQFNTHIAEGIPRHKAMVSAATERFRPIAMITLAAVLGMLPMALGRGIGAEMRTGVGSASAGGILISGILTLIVLPILYDLFTRRGTKQKRKKG